MVDYERFLSEESKYYRVSDIRKLLEVTKQKEVISLGGGLPDFRVVDLEELAKLIAEVVRRKGMTALQYSSTSGEPTFIKKLEEYAVNDLQIKLSPEDAIVVTTGSQQALDIVARGLIDPGDGMIVEKPTYVASLNVFFPRRPYFLGIEIKPEEEINIDAVEEKIRRAKAEGKRIKVLYTIPSYQNPSGYVLQEKDRRRLIELSYEYDFLIIEDDPYSLLTLYGDKPKPIKRYDDGGRVIYISTLSKVISPGLRIGFIIANESLINKFVLIKQALDLHTSTLSQSIAEELLSIGFHRKYLEKILPIYRSRRDSMIDSLERELNGYGTWTKPRGGMFVFVWLNYMIDTFRLLEKALSRGLLYVPGRGFYYDGSGVNTMRLNFSYPTEDEIRKGIKILGELVRGEVGR